MIPFNLFKYIYLRNINYILAIYLPFSIILYMLLALVMRSNEESVIILLLILLPLLIFLFFFNKFILNKLIFKEYEKIKVETELKKVNVKLTIMFILVVRVSLIIPSLGFSKIATFLFNNELLIGLFCLIVGTVMDYYITNIFLEKYIKVEEK